MHATWRQFLNHVNRYTGLAYKDDPAVVGLRADQRAASTPPAPPTPGSPSTSTPSRGAVRATGCTKPIFYNCWGGRLGRAPASRAGRRHLRLVPHRPRRRRRCCTSDYLPPRATDYPDRCATRRSRSKAKIVYEFDAADMPGSVMYPAMARGLPQRRRADRHPVPVRPAVPRRRSTRTGRRTTSTWSTPRSKAVSFAIAAEAFRRVPRLKITAATRESDRFGDFRVRLRGGPQRNGQRTTPSSTRTPPTPRPPAPGEADPRLGLSAPRPSCATTAPAPTSWIASAGPVAAAGLPRRGHGRRPLQRRRQREGPLPLARPAHHRLPPRPRRRLPVHPL